MNWESRLAEEGLRQLVVLVERGRNSRSKKEKRKTKQKTRKITQSFEPDSDLKSGGKYGFFFFSRFM